MTGPLDHGALCHLAREYESIRGMHPSNKPPTHLRHELPRERMRRLGASSLNHAEILSILLGSGVKGYPVKLIAERLLETHGSLNALARADLATLCKTPGIGPEKSMIIKAAFSLASRMMDEIPSTKWDLNRPAEIARYLRERVRLEEVECLYALFLNTRHQLIRMEEVTRGILDAVLAHPREVFRHALLHRAAAVVLVHNHPSGDPSPSEADVRLTRELIRAGRFLKINFLDHIILGRPDGQASPDFVSLRELGYFYH